MTATRLSITESCLFSGSGAHATGASVSTDKPVPEAGEYRIDAAAGDRAAGYGWAFSEEDWVGVEVVFEPDGWSRSETGG